MSTDYPKAVGVYPNRGATETALLDLRSSGFPMDQVSIVALDSDYQPVVKDVEVKQHLDNYAQEGAVAGATTGGALGTIGGILVGLGTLAIPGVGPVMLAGAAATAVATTLSGTAIGAASGTLVGALVGLSIPDDHAQAYSSLLEQGYYLIIVDGTLLEIERAEQVLRPTGIERWNIYPVHRHLDVI